MRKFFFLDIQFVHSVTIGCNEHLIQVLPVRRDGVYTDVFQVFSEVCQLSAFRGINKQLIKQGIDDKFLGRLVIINVINDVDGRNIYFLHIRQFSFIQVG